MKSKFVAYILWFFLGFFSVHRFYLGKIGSGILWLLTGQWFGIGWIIDLFLISGMVDNYNNKKQIKELTQNQINQLKFNNEVVKNVNQSKPIEK